MKSALVVTFHKINNTINYLHTIPLYQNKLYTISRYLLEETLQIIPINSCCTLADFFQKESGDWIVVTFDDGYISDFEIVVPNLEKLQLKATFFITVNNIGKNGYCNKNQLKKMTEMGMEIGSHGLTHRYLTTILKSEVIKEIRSSKHILEQEFGVSITSFAPVGGHFRKWMYETAIEAGYSLFATMIPGKTILTNNTCVLVRRNHIQAHYSINYTSKLLNGHRGSLLLRNVQYNILYILKLVLGMSFYDWLKKQLARFTLFILS